MRSNPFGMIFDGLWGMVTADPYLNSVVSLGNRMKYAERVTEKDVATTADMPELRLVPAGGSASILRTSSSTSCIRRFAFQLQTGTQNLHETYLDIQWALMCALVGWPGVVGALLWNGQPFVKRMGVIEVTELMLRPFPESNPSGEIKGWSTVWVCELECWFNSDQLRVNNNA